MNRHPSQPHRRHLALRTLTLLRHFLHIEAVSGAVLLAAAAIALIWANSPAAHGYFALWHLSWTFTLGSFSFTPTLHFLINDALMTVFFLVVGLEIRREIHEGALSSVRQAALPLAAALGGVAVPALIYTGLHRAPDYSPGWAVPTATDIAFAVGVLALLGRAIPNNVRVFLLALAIIDDIIAVLIIAFGYADGFDYRGLALAALGIALVLGCQRLKIDTAWAYVAPGALIWLGLLIAGVHPTLAGVALGLMTPVRAPRAVPPVQRVQTALHPWVAYGIMPLFALANAGVGLNGLDLSAGAAPWVTGGVALALAAGKPLGVIGISWLTVRLGWCRLPAGVDWSGVVLIGLLAGVGFTMSIFIAMLAFSDEALLSAAKLGVLLGSLSAALLGLGWGWRYARRRGVKA